MGEACSLDLQVLTTWPHTPTQFTITGEKNIVHYTKDFVKGFYRGSLKQLTC